MLLSVLIPTVPSRIDTFYPRMVKSVIEQIGDRKDIEVCAFFDNKRRSTGEKRNTLLDMARGEYLVFLDDDDQIEPDWLESVTVELRSNPDLVVYQVMLHWPDGHDQLCKYDIATKECRDVSPTLYEGHPSHTHVWRSSLAKTLRFEDKVFGEDTAWSSVLAKQVKVQRSIHRVLYHYQYNPATSETRK
jgi:glycosyltransferase involved in cell wall biosynthesis